MHSIEYLNLSALPFVRGVGAEKLKFDNAGCIAPYQLGTSMYFLPELINVYNVYHLNLSKIDQN
jgi:hypothetical protein